MKDNKQKVEEIDKKNSQDEKNEILRLENLLTDEDFIEKLKKSPREALQEEGYKFPEVKKFVLMDNGEKIPASCPADIMYLDISNSEEECSMEDMENIAGGAHIGGAYAKLTWKGFLHRGQRKGIEIMAKKDWGDGIVADLKAVEAGKEAGLFK